MPSQVHSRENSKTLKTPFIDQLENNSQYDQTSVNTLRKFKNKLPTEQISNNIFFSFHLNMEIFFLFENMKGQWLAIFLKISLVVTLSFCLAHGNPGKDTRVNAVSFNRFYLNLFCELNYDKILENRFWGFRPVIKI